MKVEVSHNEREGIVENLLQGASKIFGINIVGDVNRVARIANGLDHELGLYPFRAFGEHQHPGQIQHTVIGCKVHVLQQP